MENLSEAIIYKLLFNTPAHFGEDTTGLEFSLEYLHSDTLFGAICNGWLALFGSESLVDLLTELEAYGDGLKDSYPFLLSSAFIFSEDKFYFPKPLAELPDPPQVLINNPDLAKAFKDANFVEKEMWVKWVSRNPVIINDAATIEQLQAYKQTFLLGLQSRNYVPQYAADTTPYYCRSVNYMSDQGKESGLFFAVRFGREGLQEQFENVLTFLEKEGVGGERSSGYGFFKSERYHQTLENLLGNYTQGRPPTSYITLSLTYPDFIPGENGLENWRYALVRRRGYTSPQISPQMLRRKKNLLLFTEGSSYLGKAPRGRMLEVTPQRWSASTKIYRYGLAFPLPCFANLE
ncbi:MAG: type III-A CRISPR-associated RAMP protein Csm4 [Chloroflexi bacterium 54-19]|mgnify:CR=1 FL=1|nr:MAG: type III-A CRISPR-associated RAMP protein Csm4 [Chloroflexi bacterium 54-19]